MQSGSIIVTTPVYSFSTPSGGIIIVVVPETCILSRAALIFLPDNSSSTNTSIQICPGQTVSVTMGGKPVTITWNPESFSVLYNGTIIPLSFVANQPFPCDYFSKYLTGTCIQSRQVVYNTSTSGTNWLAVLIIVIIVIIILAIILG